MTPSPLRPLFSIQKYLYIVWNPWDLIKADVIYGRVLINENGLWRGISRKLVPATFDRRKYEPTKLNDQINKQKKLISVRKNVEQYRNATLAIRIKIYFFFYFFSAGISTPPLCIIREDLYFICHRMREIIGFIL